MSAGWRGSAGQVRRNFRQLSPTGPLDFFFTVVGLDDNLDIFFLRIPTSGRRRLGRLEAPMPGRFAETVGLDDSFEFFSWEESRPWRGLGRLQAPMPGRWRGREAMPGRHQPAEPSQSPGPLLYVLYVLCLTRQATEHPLSPGPCYMCYMCYISQGKPLNIHSPPGPCYMCYMCYISQLSPGFLAICAICAIWPYNAHIVQISRVQNI